jgi:hypothetical protein
MAEFLDGNDWQEILTDILLTTGRNREGHLDHTDVYRCPAAEDIQAGCAVALKDSMLYLASPLDGVITGVAAKSATAGSQCDYATRGLISQETWVPATGIERLVPGRNYFLIQNGRLSLTPSQTGYIICIGQAQSHFMLDVSLRQKVKL